MQKPEKYINVILKLDLETLTQTYLENTQEAELDTLENMAIHEFGWLEDSGIELSEIVESSKQTNLTRFEIFKNCSGNFLIEEVPDNWQELTKKQQKVFLEKNNWESLENMTSSKIDELIESNTESVINLLETKNIKIN